MSSLWRFYANINGPARRQLFHEPCYLNLSFNCIPILLWITPSKSSFLEYATFHNKSRDIDHVHKCLLSVSFNCQYYWNIQHSCHMEELWKNYRKVLFVDWSFEAKDYISSEVIEEQKYKDFYEILCFAGTLVASFWCFFCASWTIIPWRCDIFLWNFSVRTYNSIYIYISPECFLLLTLCI